MHTSLRRLMSSSAMVLLGATVVSAATPLPNPPFTSGGFVPPDSLTLKQEVSVGNIVSKYAASIAKCDQVTLIALQLAYEPPGAPKVPDVQAKWTACRAAVNAKYMASRDKLLLKGTPSCLDQAGIDGIKGQVDAQFPLLSPIVYCDGDAAAPDPVTGLNVPDKKDETIGEVAASKVITKAGLTAGKCYTKAAGYAFKLGGTLPPEILAKINACLAKATTVANTALSKLDQTQKLPTCLPLATAQGLAAAAISLGGQFSDETYCAQ